MTDARDPVMAALTGSADPAASAHARALQRAFVEQHSDEALAFATVDAPVGALRVVVSERGLLRVIFEDTEDVDAVMQRLADQVTPRILRAANRTATVRRELDEYFTGQRRRFTVPLDLRLAHGFRAEVLDHLQEVPFGTTVSYAALAQSAGRPTAVRAAASACATNPVPIVVPCHRVVRSDGSLGGYLGGLSAKRTLLELEEGAAA